MQYKFPSTNTKATNDLGRQYEKVVRTWNRGSYATRYRYAKAGARFIKWVQPVYKMQKLQNLQDKHIIEYGKYLKSMGLSDKYIKNEVSALKYLHFTVPNTRYTLGDSQYINNQIGLNPTPNNKAIDLNQSWSLSELKKFCEFAEARGEYRLSIMAMVTYYTGLRIEEVSTLRRHQIENAKRTGKLELENTKGGRPRTVPLNDEAMNLLVDTISKLQRGAYVFVPDNTPVYEFIHYVQDFVYRTRDNYQDPTRKNNPKFTELHWHGLRHSFGQNLYYKLIAAGYSDHEARKQVSIVLGHSRVGITHTYV